MKAWLIGINIVMVCFVALACETGNSTDKKGKVNLKQYLTGKWQISQQPCKFINYVKQGQTLNLKVNGFLDLSETKGNKEKLLTTGWWKYVHNQDHSQLTLSFKEPVKVNPGYEKNIQLYGKVWSNPSKNTFKLEFRCLGGPLFCDTAMDKPMYLECKRISRQLQ
ncbi:MAG: hypothetical protein OEZ36_01260 [Spirochaetota bacterium]|nr:hypothetical protein [Spirochaetota bacterium]